MLMMNTIKFRALKYYQIIIIFKCREHSYKKKRIFIRILIDFYKIDLVLPSLNSREYILFGLIVSHTTSSSSSSSSST